MRRLYPLVAAVILVDTMFYAAITPLLPQYADDLGLSKSGAGILSASYAAGTLVAALPSGWLAAKIGFKRCMLVGLGLLGVSSVVFAFAQSVVLLDAARFAEGVGGACAWTGGLAWLIATAPADRRGELIGAALAAAIFGILLGPVIGGIASEIGPEIVFCGVAVIAAALAARVLAFDSPPPQPVPRLRRIVSAILTRPVLFAFWLVILPSMLSGLFDVLVPLRLDALGAGGIAVGAAFFGAAALEAFTAPAIGRLSDRRGRMTPIRLGLIASPIAALVLPLPDSVILVAVALVVVVLAMSLIWTPAMALLSDNSEATGLDLAFATALVSLAWAGGQVVGGSVLSTFADVTTDGAAYALVAGLFVLTLTAVVAPRRLAIATRGRRQVGMGETAATVADNEERAGGLRRAITPRLLLIFILGDILGGGIYALVGEVGAETGGAIWAAFLLALIMAAFTAGSYAELVSKYPHAGGAALYVNRAYGIKFLSFLVAFAVVASGITSASALARGFGGDYLREFVDVKIVVGALALLALITLVNLRGIAESVKLNVGFTLVEICGLLLIVLIAVVAIFQGDAETSRAFEFKDGTSVIAATLAGATLAFYALIGFEDSVNVAEEVQDPSRNYPKILFAGLGIAGVIYFLVTVGAASVVPIGDLEKSSGPLLEVVKQGPLDIPEKLFSAIGLLALSNGAMINMIMASRLLYGMSNEKVVPRPFGIVSGRQTPWVAILFTTAIAAVLIITGDLEKLADTTVALLVVVFTIVNATVLVLRRGSVDHDHFQIPSIVPVLGVVVSIALLTQIEGETWVRAGIMIAVGIALWIVNAVALRRTSAQPARG